MAKRAMVGTVGAEKTDMPKLVYSSETVGCGATIRLDNGEGVAVSIAQVSVLVRKYDLDVGFFKRLTSNGWGATLYSEENAYKNAKTCQALVELFPTKAPELPLFKNPALAVFANAIWHCRSAAEVCAVLNEAPSRIPQRQDDTLPKPETTESPANGGTTPEHAIRIQAANSLDGIPKQYAVLKAMFGTPNQDWKLIQRSLQAMDDGRRLEKFIISAAGKRRDIYFDITEWFKGNTSKDAKSALEAIIALHEKPLTIRLPKKEFMTLQVGLLHLTDVQLNQLGLSQSDRKSMLDPFLDALKLWHGKDYASIPQHVSVTTLVSVWSKIMGLLASWQPANLLQEEELENLKAIIGGTMKDARSPSRRL